jgi:capsular polysaccharide export protein
VKQSGKQKATQKMFPGEKIAKSEEGRQVERTTASSAHAVDATFPFGAERAAYEQQRVSINPALRELSRAKRVLMLQGPVGPFYDRLARWLKHGGAKVDRVVFQGGDRFDCQAFEPIEFTGTLDTWPDFLSATLSRLKVDCVVLFGQSRRYHQVAVPMASAAGIPVVVLEEGYFRPGFVTMELGGVNGYSTTLDRYVWQPIALAERGLVTNAQPGSIAPDVSPWHFQKMAWHASRHYAAMHRARKAFPEYRHHRVEDPYHYAAYWLKSWGRKLRQRGEDGRTQQRLFSDGLPYFFVPLQHDGDAQITHHSPYGENCNFIQAVIESFAGHAPADTLLVFRQHPHARGGDGHSALIRQMATDLGIRQRVLHMIEGDTPDLAEHSAGVVLINSTVGLQALERGAPLMVKGDALYKRPGLVFEGPLEQFWWNPTRPDRRLTRSFLLQIKNLTQVSVSAYAGVDEPIKWLRAGTPGL